MMTQEQIRQDMEFRLDECVKEYASLRQKEMGCYERAKARSLALMMRALAKALVTNQS